MILPSQTRRSVTLLSLLLFSTMLAIYAASPVKMSEDSRWTIHIAASFIDGQAGRLNAYAPAIKANVDYAIEYHDGDPYGLFPIGTSLISIPFVFIAERLSPGLDAYLSNHIPMAFEGIIASLYGAAAGTVFFWMVLAKFRSVQIAGALTVIFCLGTSMWSVATRTLWQHGPLILMLTIAMLLLRARRYPASVILLGMPLAAAFVIRPTAAIPIAVLSVYVAIAYRSLFVPFAAGAAVVAAPWLIYNVHVLHHLLPAYYLPQRLNGSSTIAVATLGNLVSPARGLFVFSPILLIAIPGVVLSLRERADRGLHIAFASIILLHWLFVSRFPQWWGGYCFGPRLMSDVLPFLTYFAGFGLRAILEISSHRRRLAGIATLSTLTAISITIHAQGALSWASQAWVADPVSVDDHPERLWSWSDPQFARALFQTVPMPDFGPLLPAWRTNTKDFPSTGSTGRANGS